MALFKDTNPELLSELAGGKNQHLDLEKLRNNSSIKGWWVCKVDSSHIWESGIRGRAVLGYGCPYCSGLKTLRRDSFAAKHPDILAEWDYIKNEGTDPWGISPMSNKKVAWICNSPHQHQWYGVVKGRVINGSKCRQCLNIRNPLSLANPRIASEWHPTKNSPLTPDGVSAGSREKVWWLCPESPDHAWQSRVYSRVRLDSGCPECAKVNRSSKRYPPLRLYAPELYAQLHPSRNSGVDFLNLRTGSKQNVWWVCSENKDHVWESPVKNRSILGRGCPYCRKRTQQISEESSLLRLHPLIASEWHPTKNGDLTPNDVSSGSSKRVWWRCSDIPEHEWEALVEQRTNKKRSNKCPYCSGYEVTESNSLASCVPEIAKEWHPEKNSLTPSEIKRASGKKVWWRCCKNPEHEWEATVKNRTVLGSSCPVCGVETRARKLQIHLLEIANSNSDYFQTFNEAMDNLVALSKTKLSGSTQSRNHFRRMLYSSAITNLETFLSDAFRQSLGKDASLSVKLLRSSPDFKDRRFDIDDVLSWNGRIDEKIGEYLLDIVWHNLAKIRQMYSSILSVDFPPDSGAVHKAVALRHDIVHRNGKRKDGSIQIIRESDLKTCFEAVRAFVDHIQAQLNFSCPNPSSNISKSP